MEEEENWLNAEVISCGQCGTRIHCEESSKFH